MTNTNKDEDIQIEAVTSAMQVSFIEPTITANLPRYTKVNTHLNKDYNNIDKVTFTHLVHQIYEESVKWKKNLFLIPTGQCGKDFIKLKTE